MNENDDDGRYDCMRIMMTMVPCLICDDGEPPVCLLGRRLGGGLGEMMLIMMMKAGVLRGLDEIYDE